MKLEIDIPFAPGDEIWHKNLVTNESIKTKIKSFNAMKSVYIDKEGNLEITGIIIYHTEDGIPLTNIIGEQPSSNSAFATKEECDAAPAYDPSKVRY